ncbi:hypothetical protein MHYP_G00282600 [Metynnis hypsauchen]
MQYVGIINVTSDLQSDVLLPCNFEATLLGSNKTADIAAVWSHRSTPAENLLEISLQGEVMFWNNRDKRIKTVPKLSESGNFSILLRNVQQSDLGLYRCELHEGINCMIAYQEVQLAFTLANPMYDSVRHTKKDGQNRYEDLRLTTVYTSVGFPETSKELLHLEEKVKTVEKSITAAVTLHNAGLDIVSPDKFRPAQEDDSKLCSGTPFEMVTMDILGTFPTTDVRNHYFLVAMDYFTK